MPYFNKRWKNISNSYFWKANLSVFAAALAVYTHVYVIVPKIEQQTRDFEYSYHQKKIADMRDILYEKLFWLNKARGDPVHYKRLMETAISVAEEDVDGTEQAKANYKMAANDNELANAGAKHKQLLESIIFKAYEEASLKKQNGKILENPDLV